MKTLELNTDHYPKPKDWSEFFNYHKLSEGDRVEIKGAGLKEKLPDLIAIAVAITINQHGPGNKKHRITDSKNILKELYQKTTKKELEKLLKNELGIEVSFQTSEEKDEEEFRKDLYQLAGQSMKNYCAEDEPDYSNVPLIEKNPDYNPDKWK